MDQLHHSKDEGVQYINAKTALGVVAGHIYLGE